jgi:hypothetical protein
MNIDTISIIGSEWADPIGDLAYAFEQRLIRQKEINHLTPSYRGSCCSIIVLLMLMLESSTIRAEFDSENTTLDANSLFEASAWWKRSCYQDRENILDAFVIRNSLVHNHLYYHFANNGDIRHLNGGSKADRMRINNGILIHSGLSCDPSIIGPKELLLICATVNKALQFLKHNSANIGVVDYSFARRGGHKNLWETIYSAANLADAKIAFKEP